MISREIVQCTDDMYQAAQSGKITLDAQVRAYDLLERIMDLPDGVSPESAEKFCSEYARLAPALEAAFNETDLQREASERLEPFKDALVKAAVESAEKTALHQCARETFEIWQSGGFFARLSSLRRLRALAGFRLESGRIGNFVAKTFDLMNEAQAAHARAQQALFAANVSYKIRSGVYSGIASYFRSTQFQNLHIR